jgi:HAD superfamily hydrolase (TIGR01490 family)
MTSSSPSPPSIAFIDFDGTLLIRESRTLTALPAIRRGLVPAWLGVQVFFSYIAYKLGLFPRERANAIAFRCYAGQTPAAIQHAVDGMHTDILQHWLSDPVVSRIEAHQRAGDMVVIATAAASYFAHPTAVALGISHVLGTELEVDDGRCTGRVVDGVLEGDRKLKRAQAFAEQHGVDLAVCAFYSDHINDLPLMAAVGRPVAVGPSKALRREAGVRGWEIVEHPRR